MSTFAPKTLSQIRALSHPGWLIDGLIQANGTTLLYGPPKVGKTFLALDWSLSICTKREWSDRKTSGGNVIYVIAEGAFGIGERINAWLTERGGDEAQVEEAFFAVDKAVNLMNEKTVGEIVDWGKKHQPKLIVFDTLARCAGIEDENDAGQMNKVMRAIDQIREETGGSILIIHHQGKNRTRGARGSSALEAAVDTVISFDEYYGKCRLQVTKQRNAPEINAIGLMFKKVSLPSGTSQVLALATLKKSDQDPSPSNGTFKPKPESNEKIEAIRKVLQGSDRPLLVSEIFDALPEQGRPSQATIKKWLEGRAVTGARKRSKSAARNGWYIPDQ
jgi:hypothetical protein